MIMRNLSSVRSVLCKWQMDHKRRPSPPFTADTNSTIMCLYDLLHDGKPQSCPMFFATRPCGIDLVETIEQMRQRTLRHAHPGICDRDLHLTSRACCTQHDMPARRSELQGVIHQVREDLG